MVTTKDEIKKINRKIDGYYRRLGNLCFNAESKMDSDDIFDIFVDSEDQKKFDSIVKCIDDLVAERSKLITQALAATPKEPGWYQKLGISFEEIIGRMKAGETV